MSKVRARLVAAGLIAACASCISFRIDSPPPEGFLVEAVAFCPRVEEEGEVMKPLDPRSDFNKEDVEVCCFIKVRLVAEPLTLRWKWYAPDKTLYRDTGEVPLGSGNPEIAIVSAYDRIIRDAEGLAQGTWTVAVFLNGHLAARGAFKMM